MKETHFSRKDLNHPWGGDFKVASLKKISLKFNF
jgi:hypothetical protein